MEPFSNQKGRLSVKDCGFFEGAEKLLEIWFDFSNSQRGLLNVTKDQWTEVLKFVKCEIIGITASDVMTAYLLSESSMFVSRERLILKTCGRTTILNVLTPLLDCVKKNIGGYSIKDFFYSRKNFLEPSNQIPPHCSFENEMFQLRGLHQQYIAQWISELKRPELVTFLKKYFPEGKSMSYGPPHQQWYLFLLHEGAFQTQPDRTLEILMSGISDRSAELFTYECYPSGMQMMQKSGLESLFPEADKVDPKAFEPCGYSMNVIIQDDEYCNIHVTPQVECSYASLETNSGVASYDDIIRKVLEIFEPTSCIVTFFTNQEEDIPLFLLKERSCACDVQEKALYGYHLTVAAFQFDT